MGVMGSGANQAWAVSMFDWYPTPLRQSLSIYPFESLRKVTTILNSFNAHFELNPDATFHALLAELPVDRVQMINDTCAATQNSEHKLAVMTKQFFRVELAQLKTMENKVLNMESLLRDLTELCFAGAYANDKGEYQWTKLTTHLGHLIRVKGQAEGAAAAAAPMQA